MFNFSSNEEECESWFCAIQSASVWCKNSLSVQKDKHPKQFLTVPHSIKAKSAGDQRVPSTTINHILSPMSSWAVKHLGKGYLGTWNFADWLRDLPYRELYAHAHLQFCRNLLWIIHCFFQTRLLTVHISEARLLSHMFILDRCNVQPCWCRLCILHYGKKEAFILTTLLIKNQCRQRQRIDHKGHKYY